MTLLSFFFFFFFLLLFEIYFKLYSPPSEVQKKEEKKKRKKKKKKKKKEKRKRKKNGTSLTLIVADQKTPSFFIPWSFNFKKPRFIILVLFFILFFIFFFFFFFSIIEKKKSPSFVSIFSRLLKFFFQKIAFVCHPPKNRALFLNFFEKSRLNPSCKREFNKKRKKWFGKKKMEKEKKKVFSTGDSNVVTHHSTNPAHRCLTSEFRWDRVLSPGYDRRQALLWWLSFCESKVVQF